MRSVLTILIMLLGVGFALGQENPKPKDGSEAPRISLEEAKKAFDKKTAIFVDSRGRETYKQEHIKGAINMSTGEFPDLNALPKDKTIIVYCSWPQEHTSASLVLTLMDKGIKNVFALKGGTQAWKDAGYPMEKD